MKATLSWNVPPAAVRDRVAELFGKSDPRIARALIAEKVVTVKEGTFDALPPEERARLEDVIRRTVNNHRRKLLAQWKDEPIPKPGDKQSAHEFIARLRTRIEDLEKILEGGLVKSTAKVNALAEIRQLETLIAQVKNVDVSGRRLSRLIDAGDDDAQNPLPFMGLLLDWKNVSPETKESLLGDRRDDKRDAAAAGKTA